MNNHGEAPNNLPAFQQHVQQKQVAQQLQQQMMIPPPDRSAAQFLQSQQGVLTAATEAAHLTEQATPGHPQQAVALTEGEGHKSVHFQASHVMKII